MRGSARLPLWSRVLLLLKRVAPTEIWLPGVLLTTSTLILTTTLTLMDLLHPMGLLLTTALTTALLPLVPLLMVLLLHTALLPRRVPQ